MGMNPMTMMMMSGMMGGMSNQSHINRGGFSAGALLGNSNPITSSTNLALLQGLHGASDAVRSVAEDGITPIVGMIDRMLGSVGVQGHTGLAMTRDFTDARSIQYELRIREAEEQQRQQQMLLAQQQQQQQQQSSFSPMLMQMMYAMFAQIQGAVGGITGGGNVGGGAPAGGINLFG